MRIKRFLLGVMLGLAPLFGQQIQLNLDTAIKLAIQNNREIEIAKLNVKKSRAAVSEAFGYAMPNIDISAGLNHFLEKPKTPFPDFKAMLNNSTYSVLFDEGLLPRDEDKFLPLDFKLQSFAQTNSFETKIQATQILFNSAVFRGIGASQIYLNLAKENLRSAIAQTAFNVQKAFYGALLTKELYNIAQARFKNANEHLQNIKAMGDQGLVSDFASLQAEVQVENIRPILVQLSNANIDAVNGLKILINLKQDTTLNIVGALEYQDETLPTDTDLINEAKKSNFTLKILRIKKQLDDEFTAIDRGGYWPTLAAFGNYSYSGSGDKWTFQNYSSSIIGVSFSINLFQGGRTKHKVEQDVITANQTIEQIHSLNDATEMQIKSNINNLKRINAQISAMQRNISLAQRAYEISEDRYKQGEGSPLEVKDADVSLSNAKTNYTNAVHDYLLSRAKLNLLLGRTDKKYFNLVDDYLND